MKHQGEQVRKVIKESGISITSLCKKMQKSRRWLYDLLQQPQVSVDVLLQLSNALHYNFLADFPEYAKFQHQLPSVYNEDSMHEESAIYWREKYYNVLEHYSSLMQEKLNEQNNKKHQ